MSKPNIQEPGYRAVLVREETKTALQGFRSTLEDRDLNQERRLVTAAIEILLDSPEMHHKWLRRVDDVVRRDIDNRTTAVG